MKITRDNYELYVVDFIEGTLDEALVDAMHNFLNANPEIKIEIEESFDIKLPKESHSFNGKSELKQSPEIPSINDDNVDGYLSRALDNDLSLEETIKLQDSIRLNEKWQRLHSANRAFPLKGEKISADKTTLYKPLGEYSLEEALILFLDEELNNEERMVIETFISDHPSSTTLLKELQTSKLEPIHVPYPYKASLKQKALVFSIRPAWYAAAAVGLALIGILQLMPSEIGIRTYTPSKGPGTMISSEIEDDFKFVISNNQKPSHGEDPAENVLTPSPDNYVAQNANNGPIDSTNAFTAKDVKDSLLSPISLPDVNDIAIDTGRKASIIIDTITPKLTPLPSDDIAMTEQEEGNYKSLSEKVIEKAEQTLNTNIDVIKTQDDERSVTHISVGKFSFTRNKKK